MWFRNYSSLKYKKKVRSFYNQNQLFADQIRYSENILTIFRKTQLAEAVVQMYSVKNVFLKPLQNSQENTCARIFFLIKLQATLLKKESSTGVFLLILLNFQEHFSL